MTTRDEIEARLEVYDYKLKQNAGLKNTDAAIARADVLWNVLHTAPTDLRHLLDALAAAEAEVQRLQGENARIKALVERAVDAIMPWAAGKTSQGKAFRKVCEVLDACEIMEAFGEKMPDFDTAIRAVLAQAPRP